ncbi:MAG TPA: hypothetical protein VI485_31745 [Vicinamibacterales bacterium]|nr:hypothetical protein [Vicinamibacterales bacterium]
MTSRYRPSVPVAVTAFVVAMVAVAPALAQTSNTKPAASGAAAGAASSWTLGRTADGQPDLQGTWINFDSTPFEAPLARPAAAARTGAPGANVGPASEFADHNHQVSKARRSMVVEPPDGRVPVMKWAEDKRDYDLAHLPDAPEHETPWVRCITRGYPAGMFPAGYNNAYEIIQVPGYVVIALEMIHETRLIPIDGRPRLGEGIRQWNGEPRGRWDGNTLVVESTNYNNKGSIATSAATGRIRGIPQSEAMRVVERFTRTDANTINYTVTIEDPKVYSRPWTVALPLNRDDSYQMFEYSCHEGNLAMRNSLSYGRMRDKEAAQPASR